MSAIPPNWLGSIIQTQGAQERAGQAKAAEEAKGAARARFSEQLSEVIENDDRDAEVYADAEGAGGRGSPFSEDEEAATEDAEKLDADQEADGGRLDLEA